MLTLRQAKGADFSALKVLVVGDIRHSRVARSDLQALRTLGAGEVRACGPRTLLPEDATLDGCTVMRDFDAALAGVDAGMMLRMQRGRMAEGLVSSRDDCPRAQGLPADRQRRPHHG